MIAACEIYSNEIDCSHPWQYTSKKAPQFGSAQQCNTLYMDVYEADLKNKQ